MNVQFLILIFVLNNVYGYKPDRKIESVSNLKPNKKIEITPARYQIANKKTNIDAIVNRETPVDNFPAMEYPTNLMESSKPFYISTSPFPQDVKTSFDFITSTSKTKLGNTDYSAIKDEIAKAKEKFTSLRKQDYEVDNKTIVETIANEASIETWADIGAPVMDFEDLLTNWTSTEDSYEDVDYTLGFIKHLDEVMTNLNEIDLQSVDQNSTECSTIDATTKNNVSLNELYGNVPLSSIEQKKSCSLFTEFDTREDPFNVSCCLDANESENIDDMQESIFEIRKTANETSYDDGLQ